MKKQLYINWCEQWYHVFNSMQTYEKFACVSLNENDSNITVLVLCLLVSMHFRSLIKKWWLEVVAWTQRYMYENFSSNVLKGLFLHGHKTNYKLFRHNHKKKNHIFSFNYFKSNNKVNFIFCLYVSVSKLVSIVL